MEVIKNIDLELFHLINSTTANPLLDYFCPIIRSRPFLFACYVLFTIAIYKSAPKKFFIIVFGGGIAFLLTDQISASLIKPIFHRLRPCNDPQVFSRLLIDHCGTGFSFVSAHATNSFGMAVFISMFLKHNKWFV